MNEKMERIKKGTRPTEILREIIAANRCESLRIAAWVGSKSAIYLFETCRAVSYGVALTVSGWKEFREGGCSDKAVDVYTLEMMRNAGLL